jgi:hypothetical protein
MKDIYFDGPGLIVQKTKLSRKWGPTAFALFLLVVFSVLLSVFPVLLAVLLNQESTDQPNFEPRSVFIVKVPLQRMFIRLAT